MKIRLRYVALALFCAGVAGVAALNSGGPQDAPGVAQMETEVPAVVSQRAETTFVYAVNPPPQSTQSAKGPGPVVDMHAALDGKARQTETPGRDCVAELEDMAQVFTIRFDRGDSRIDAQGRDILRVVGAAARDCPQAHLILAGHADASGDVADNLRISWARADAAMATLRALKLDGVNVEPRGFGAEEPFAQGDAGEDAENRRVGFRVIRVDGTQP